MSIGTRLKRIRIFRRMTQAELGNKLDLPDSRIRQYELNIKKPRTDMLQKLSSALACNPNAIDNPNIDSPENIMYCLFELEEFYNISIDSSNSNKVSINFDSTAMEKYLSEWTKKKNELASGEISKDEYFEWKINWGN